MSDGMLIDLQYDVTARARALLEEALFRIEDEALFEARRSIISGDLGNHLDGNLEGGSELTNRSTDRDVFRNLMLVWGKLWRAWYHLRREEDRAEPDCAMLRRYLELRGDPATLIGEREPNRAELIGRPAPGTPGPWEWETQ